MARKRHLFYITIQSLVRAWVNVFQSLLRNKIIIILIVGILLIVEISPVFSQIPASQLNNPHSLVREGEELYRQQQLSQAIEYFQKAAKIFEQKGDKFNQAITLTNLGRLHLELGKANDALNNWEIAKGIYVQLGDKVGVIRSQIYQADALQKLGFYPRACGILLQSLQVSEPSCEGLRKERLATILDEIQLKNRRDAEYAEKGDVLEEQYDLLLLIGWRSLGDVLRGIGKLEESRFILEIIAKFDSYRNQAATLLSLGNTLTALGHLERDRNLVKYSTLSNYQPWYCSISDYILPIEAFREYQNAELQYQRIIDDFPRTSIAIKAKINLLNIWLIRSKFKSSPKNDTRSLLSEAGRLLSEINISSLPPQEMVYAQINLAKSRICLTQLIGNQVDWLEVFQELQIAQEEAENTGDNRVKSYAVGNLGGFYEYRGWWLEQNSNHLKNLKDNLCKIADDCFRKAQKFTEEALYLAQPSKEPFIAYQWQSQLGRLLDNQGKRDDAITAYNGAINTLESVRYNLLAVNSDVQFSFLENIEPVYRRLLGLLLQTQVKEEASQDSLFSVEDYGEKNRRDTEYAEGRGKERTVLLDGGRSSQDNLFRAIQVSESLQLAELENLLRCRLDSSKTIKIDQFEKPPAAIIHPILLEDRIEVIVQIPGTKKLRRYTTKISQGDLNEILFNLQNLRSEKKYNEQQYILPYSQKLYNWLIRPVEADLPGNGTLVFIVDSTLESIPFAMLHDGKQYLVRKYSIAVNLVSQLPNQGSSKFGKRNALLAGISKKAESFPKQLPQLPYVEDELKGIEKVVSNKLLKNEQFTSEALMNTIIKSNFKVVHLATHGNFASNREQTYIYAWDKKIKLDELDQILRIRGKTSSQPIELLVLSACETAQGDRRAALGIAGVALKAEARSTIASLWQVNDASTAELMKLFYKELSKPNMSKAEALRKVQIHFLDNSSNYKHPYYWASFILVGNWL
ncbi:MAG: CHAT domain-containing protein [Nostocales cyanobacterium 94392]|nr:CHAT domain-containing protein [Nostocales cyanobacterium 94392]